MRHGRALSADNLVGNSAADPGAVAPSPPENIVAQTAVPPPKPAPTPTSPSAPAPSATPLPPPVVPTIAPPASTTTTPTPLPTGDIGAALPQGDVGEGVYLNATELDLKELIKQISKATSKNFLLDDQIKGKITIISETKMTLDEAYQAFLSALSVAGYTTVEGPAGLIKVIPLKEAVQHPISIYKGTSPVTDNYITRVITLANISALDVSNVIKGLVSKDGNIIAYPATNTLIITDTGSNIDRIMQLIRELDREGPQQTIELVPIRYATAKDITEKLNQLFDTASQGGTKAAATTRRTRTADKSGQPGEDVPDISKIIPDDRTNSVIILGSKRGIADLKEIIAKLDTPLEGAEGTIHVHYLQHAVAKELAEVLSNLTSGAGAAKKEVKGEKETAAPTAEFEGGIKVTADENTNSLVIVASPKDYETLVAKVVSRLDIPRRQVYLESIIMELSVNKNSSFSVGGQGGGIFATGVGDALGFGSLFGTTASSLGAATSALGGLAGGLVSTSTVNVPVTQSDGTITNISIPAFGLVLNAVQNNNNANILSTPSLLTLDNEEAEILVGNEVPFQTGSTVSSTGTQVQVTREDVGIILKITPQINESDSIRLKISQEISNVVAATVVDPNGPTTTKRSVNTVVVAQNQQTIVIGGLLQDNSSIGINKIPLFGDIPLLGSLFKTRNKQRAKNNILVFITPYIIRDRSDFMVILKRKIEERNQFIDYNYGRGVRKGIRKDIERHAAHLLDTTTIETSMYEPYKKPEAKLISSTATPPTPILEKETIPSDKGSAAKKASPTPVSTPAPAPTPAPVPSTPPATTPPVSTSPTSTSQPSSSSSPSSGSAPTSDQSEWAKEPAATLPAP